MTNSLKKLLPLIFLTLFGGLNAFAQEVSVKIRITLPNRVSIEGNFKDESVSLKNWSYLQNYADVTNLADRIKNLQLFDNKGAKIEVRKLNAGEYLTNQPPKSFKYEVDLTPSVKLTDSAHASWLTENYGLLMLADLLPNFNHLPKSASSDVHFELPPEFQIFAPFPPYAEVISQTNLSAKLKNLPVFNVRDTDNAVFLIGKNLRTKSFLISNEYGGRQFDFITTGEWKFTDDEAFAAIQTLIKEYHQTIGSLSNWKTNIILLPFPQENPNPDRWRAETRGSTVTIISGALPFKNQAIQRLHEQLRHEIFHLWTPKGLALSGNYDWFYEGFTIYHALRTGVELNQIRFDDFLNTLGRAYEMAQVLSESQQITLLEASEKRWTGTSNLVYAKGLIVAFLCDVALLRQSKGKMNLKTVFRKIYDNHSKYQKVSPHKANEIVDGNLAITGILKSFPELLPVVQNYIEGRSKIDWQNELNEIGIEQEREGFNTRLKVIGKPNGRQKDLLDKLGYNQWRKLLQKTK